MTPNPTGFHPKTWRELLQALLESPPMKEQLVKASGLHAATLDRWVKGHNKPRPETLRSLVLASGGYQDIFLELIQQEHPAFSLNDQPPLVKKEIIVSELSLYRDTMKAVSHTPASQRYWTVQNLILEHMLAVLAPTCAGIGISLMQCVASEHDNRVLCLRAVLRRATPPWSDDYSPRLFIGSESISGRTVETARAAICQNIRDESVSYPMRKDSDEMEASVAAFPILCELNVAGCIVINCLNDYYFTEERLQQFEAWADLLSQGFSVDEYYRQNEIALQKMPALEIQEQHFAAFQEMVIALRRNHAQEGTKITQMQAEKQVWQQLAEKMIPSEAGVSEAGVFSQQI